MLRGISRHKNKVASLARSYASGDVAVSEQSPFLRFATPVPQAYNNIQALGSVPETKVRPPCLSGFSRLGGCKLP